MDKTLKKTIACLCAALAAGAAFANATAVLKGAIGSASQNKVKIGYTIVADGEYCEDVCAAIYSDATCQTLLFEYWLDEAGAKKYGTPGNHTLVFPVAGNYTVSEIRTLFPEAVVMLYTDFCTDDVNPYEENEAVAKLSYSSSSVASQEIPAAVKTMYGKARVVTTALVRDSADYKTAYADGLVKFGISRHNSKGLVKVQAIAKEFFGKQEKATAVAKPAKDGSLSTTLSFPSLGVFNVTVDSWGATGDVDFAGSTENGERVFEYMNLGGTLDSDTAELSFDEDSVPSKNVPALSKLDLVTEILPSPAAIEISGGVKLSAGTVPKLSFVRQDSGEPTAGDQTYGNGWVLKGANDDSAPNPSSLTLKYSKSSGVFQGSFKVYYTNAGSTTSKPKAKAAKARVRGVVENGGSGSGQAAVKIGSSIYTWPVELIY